MIPNHICPCVNLEDTVWLRREDGSLEAAVVDAREVVMSECLVEDAE